MILTHDPTRTFNLLPSPRAMGGFAISCRVCGRVSHHPEDVARRYCGHCHAFHDTLGQRVAAGQLQIAPNELPVIGYNLDGAAPVFEWTNGTQTTVIPVLFGRGRLIACDLPDYWINPDTGVEDGHAGISRFWCYDSYWLAVSALLTWKPLEESDPVGWVKSSDERRRLNGDSRYEYRNFDEELEARRRFMDENQS
jgi:hypothetical protein